jgi:hypothetical protein
VVEFASRIVRGSHHKFAGRSVFIKLLGSEFPGGNTVLLTTVLN